VNVRACTAANLEEPQFIAGRHRRDTTSSQTNVADSVTTDTFMHTTLAAHGLSLCRCNKYINC